MEHQLQSPFQKKTPAGVTIKSFLDSCHRWRKAAKKAVKQSLCRVNSIPQAPSPFNTSKQMQRKLNVDSNGNYEMMKQVVNETGAYVLQQNEKTLKELN
jgi:hypothetical protein